MIKIEKIGMKYVGKWVTHGIVKTGCDLWYRYVVRFHLGDDNIHRNQQFLHSKRYDDPGITVFRFKI